MDYKEKVSAWEAYYKEAQEEADTVRREGLMDIAKVTQDRVRLIEAPAAHSIKISMHMSHGAKPQTREWKNPTAEEMSVDIPKIISRALRDGAHAHRTKIEQVPTPGDRNRFWKNAYADAENKVSYAMLMLTNARNDKVVPLPPLGKPIELPVASINENTSRDPDHVPGETLEKVGGASK